MTQGWLLKRGAINKGFKKRWFSFKGDFLEYRVGPGHEPRGKIPLASIDKVTLSTTEPYELFLSTPGRVFVIRSADNTRWILEAWQRSISDAIQAKTTTFTA